MKKQSKRYRAITKDLDKNKSYNLKEAVSFLKKIPPVKFDQTLNLDLFLNIDPKKPEQLIRGTVILPHGTGKKIRIAVFCKGEHEKEAAAAGADIIGGQELIDKVAGGFFDFDSVIATPEMMKDLSKLGKVLGPKGLMPSPKTGTVTNNVSGAIKDLKKGKVEFKVDKQRGIHLGVGKTSFTEEQLFENASRLLEAIQSSKPSSVKGQFIKSIFIGLTMGPSVSLVL